MDLAKYTPIIYDIRKQNGSGYGNGREFDLQILERDYTIITNIDAIKFYNTKIKNYLIPTTLDVSLFNPRFYFKDEPFELYSIFFISHEELETIMEYNKDYAKIFLFESIKHHLGYGSYYSAVLKQLHSSSKQGSYSNRVNNIEYFINKATEKVTYSLTDTIDIPDEIKPDLFAYQKETVKWLYEREMNTDEINYVVPRLVTQHAVLEMGNVVINLRNKTLNAHNRASDMVTLKFRGGGLIEDVGLGKTLEIITLFYMNPPQQLVDNDIVIDEDDSDPVIDDTNTSFGLKRIVKDDQTYYYSRATLVVCPNQLFGQWKDEIQKMTKTTLKIIVMTTKVHLNKYTYKDIIEADFVVVTFNFLKNDAFIDTWYNYKNMLPYTAREKLDSIFNKVRETLKDTDISKKKNVIFPLIYWNRFVIDEFHELYYNDKFSWKQKEYVKKIVNEIKSEYRWVVTATPFIHKKKSIIDILEFINDYPISNKLLYNKDTCDKLARDIFRRNTKDSVKEELTLPPIIEETKLLTFSPTELTMYNAYRSNKTTKHDDLYLRKLCCDPRLAQEDSSLLGNCKSLEDIQNTMVSHHQQQVLEQKNRVDRTQKQLLNIDDEISKLSIDKLDNKKVRKLKENLEECLLQINLLLENSDGTPESMDLIDTMLKTNDRIGKDLQKSKELTTEQFDRLNELKAKRVEVVYKLDEYVRQLEGKEKSKDFFDQIINILRSEELGECPICMDDISRNSIGVTHCGHIFCYNCLEQSLNLRNSCPHCRRVTRNDEYYMMKLPKNKDEEDEDEGMKYLINQVGTKLANLIKHILPDETNFKDMSKKKKNNKDNEKYIIFSQWDDVLRKVSDILTMYGIKNVFCKGHCYQRNKAIQRFSNDSKVKAIMLSSSNAASGANLTKATQIIMIDPVYGTHKFRKETEEQAIGRAHRLGQHKSLKVVRLIVQDTIEEEIYNKNMLEDQQEN